MVLESTGSSREYGLAPILGKDPAVLILGSFPSKLSLQRHQYYANPHNQFWRLMSDLLDLPEAMDIPFLAGLLKDHHIAVWDVIGSRSFQKGSMDRDITDPLFNNIPVFIGNHPTIQFIGMNGEKAWKSFQRSVRGIPFEHPATCKRLPSTSPAFASFSYEQKLLRWRTLLEYVE